VSLKLGLRTVHGLLDTAPSGMAGQIKTAVEANDGVLDCHAVRIRQSGPYYFVDLHVLLDGSQSLEQAHAVTERIESSVQVLLPGADVTVHPEPWKAPAPETPAA
jgi:divalent metal cation (Fe/Co/Zn/Cd) transporter